MEIVNLTEKQKSVVDILKKEHLTSFQILTRVKNISIILVLYKELDGLYKKGMLGSYIKNNLKYYYIP
ncbi:hypothetical protein BTO18_01115 [Polaribacter porphyrae]|uniref:Transcriptional regulator n=2 Tax=Polaribacter porphyrae TaxID=1137780 RepID=A0A2S7WTC7_9FLAO|nr:hypothetical protein BTO18_01115 [Polaribacter porphyrae]